MEMLHNNVEFGTGCRKTASKHDGSVIIRQTYETVTVISDFSCKKYYSGCEFIKAISGLECQLCNDLFNSGGEVIDHVKTSKHLKNYQEYLKNSSDYLTIKVLRTQEIGKILEENPGKEIILEESIEERKGNVKYLVQNDPKFIYYHNDNKERHAEAKMDEQRNGSVDFAESICFVNDMDLVPEAIFNENTITTLNVNELEGDKEYSDETAQKKIIQTHARPKCKDESGTEVLTPGTTMAYLHTTIPKEYSNSSGKNATGNPTDLVDNNFNVEDIVNRNGSISLCEGVTGDDKIAEELGYFIVENKEQNVFEVYNLVNDDCKKGDFSSTENKSEDGSKDVPGEDIDYGNITTIDEIGANQLTNIGARIVDGQMDKEVASTRNNVIQNNVKETTCKKVKRSVNPKRGRFPCGDCGKISNYIHNLKQHQLIHTGEKIHKCDQCDMRFLRRGDMKTHQLTHIGEKTHFCVTCGKGFLQKRYLTRHQLIHVGERNYTCETCGSKFLRKSDLKQHTVVHTGEKKHVCDICRKKFTQISSLKSHEVIHSDEKEHICDACGKTLRESELKRHQLTHTGEHICDICSKGFSAKRNMKRHRLLHTGEKKHNCDVCGKKFLRRDKMLKHQSTHTGKPRFATVTCDEIVFSQNENGT